MDERFTDEDVERVAEAIRAYHAPHKPRPQLWERGLARAALSAYFERGEVMPRVVDSQRR